MLQQIQENTENYPSSHDVAPYTAIDPFTPSIARSIANVTPSTYLPTIQPPITYQTFQATADGFTAVPTSRYVIAFLLDTLPRQIYLYFLLTLPSLYFSRVSRIFVEAELSKPIIERMIISSRVDDWSITRIQNTFNMTPLPFDSHVIASFKTSWEQFVDSMMKEWKTLNLVTVLLLSAILTTLQIDDAVTDPYTRYFAFVALVCSLMSLLYGCIYTIRFNTMRRLHKAAEWAEEVQKTRTFIWWNVWVLLAMPAVWLSWSIIFYLTCIMTFLWRTGTTSDIVIKITPLAALGPRLSITLTFVLGLVYLCLIIIEFRRYGAVMDKAWKMKVHDWRSTTRNTFDVPYDSSSQSMRSTPFSYRPPIIDPVKTDYRTHWLSPADRLPRNLPEVPFDMVKIIDLHAKAHKSYTMPWFLEWRSIGHITWNEFILDASRTWDEPQPRLLKDSESSSGAIAQQDLVAQLIARWNDEVFLPLRVQAVLCEEQTGGEPALFSYAIYLIDLVLLPNKPAAALQGEQLAHRFGQIPVGIQRLKLCDPVQPYGDIQKLRSRLLHEYLATSRQSDSTSRPLSTFEAGAAEDPGEDAKSFNDEDGHDEHVPNLYHQPAIGSTGQELSKDTTTSSKAREEDNGLSTLPDHEISQNERQLNQHDLDVEYNVHDLEGWPDDWRSDYGEIIPGQQRSTTSVDEFKDPTQRAIRATLSYISESDPCVICDLRCYPKAQTLSFPIRRIYEFAHFATDPPVEHMRLCHPLLPWYIDVHQSQPNGIRVGDVLVQVFWELQLQIRGRHYHNTDVDTGTRITRAFERRTQDNKEEREKGIKKLDYLEGEVFFVGLVRTGQGLWEMKTIASL